MGKLKQLRLKNEVKETLKSKERYRWYSEIQRLLKKGWTVKDACKETRIGRSEYYYWDRRIREKTNCMKPGSRITANMFKALSKTPHHSPKQIPENIVQLIIKIRKKTNQGAEYVRYHLIKEYQITLSITGIHKVLKREGLIAERKYHKKKKPYIVERNYKPGEKVQVDTKYVKAANGKTYYQFGAIDLATGIIFKQLFEHIDGRSACMFIRNAVAYYPFCIQKIKTDNGFEYTWRLTPEIKKTHPFTLQCELMGIEHLLIPPASPTYNSHIERTHRVDKEELWNKNKYYSLISMKKSLKKYVSFYNYKRATPSKNWRPPIQYANEEFGLNINRLIYRVQDV